MELQTYELAELDYINGMKYKDIAEKYNVSINTVKSWKTRYKWIREDGVHTQEKVAAIKEKSMHTHEKVCTQKDKSGAETKREGKKVISDEVKQVVSNKELTDKQRLFCLYYSKTFNATQSYAKAYECSYINARGHAHEMLKRVEVKNEIERLKALKMQQVVVSEEDMVEFHMRVAFADIGDYMEFGRKKIITGEGREFEVNEVRLNNSENVDTQLIKEVKVDDKGGVSIKLIDRCKSLEWLDRYFLMNPMDKHKLKYDEKRYELEVKKAKLDQDNKEPIKIEFVTASTSTKADDKYGNE